MEMQNDRINFLILEEIKGLRKDIKEDALQLRNQLLDLFNKQNDEFDASKVDVGDIDANDVPNLIITKVASLAAMSQLGICESKIEPNSFVANTSIEDNSFDNDPNFVLNQGILPDELQTDGLVEHVSSSILCNSVFTQNQIIQKYPFTQKNSFTNISIKQEPSDDFSDIRAVKPWPNIDESISTNAKYSYDNNGESDVGADDDANNEDVPSSEPAVRKKRLCMICHTMIDGDIFEDHVKSHVTAANFMCQVCGKTFVTSLELAKHTLSHDDTKPFQCTHCQKSFNRLSHLEKHSLMFHSIELLYPSDSSPCKDIKPLHSIEENAQISNRTRKAKKNKCPKCNKAYIQKSNLSRHIKRVHSQKPSLQKIVSLTGKLSSRSKFQCYVCKNVFSSKASLRRHLQNIHSIRSKSHAGKSFSSRTKSTAKKPPIKNIFSCYLCNRTFALRYCLSQHIEKCHASQFDAFLEKTNKETNHDNSSFSNNASDSSINSTFSKQVQCPICKKIIANSGNLKRHLKAIHSKDEIFKCSICSARFLTKQRLSDHLPIHLSSSASTIKSEIDPELSKSDEIHNSIEKTPSNITFPICTFCDKKFGKLSDLRRHTTLAHANEHMCLECFFVFGRKDMLLTHMQSNHQEASFQIIYECDKCHIACTSETNIRKHEALHSNTSTVGNLHTYTCSICGCPYWSKSGLHRHKKTKHPQLFQTTE